MGITTQLYADAAALDLSAASKATLLDSLAAEAATRLGRPEADILEALQARERLGSTGLGRGVALPHAQLGQIDRPVVSFARLGQPIDFDAKDGEPVDLVFLVLWPADATAGFLPALAEIVRVLREPKLLRQLRAAPSAAEALRLLRAAGHDAPGGIDASGTSAR